MFTLAHLSDPHLPPLPNPGVGALLNKRLLGYLSWTLKRRHIHLRDVLDRLTADVKQLAPDHVAITGDLVNISLESEFINAKQWLNDFGNEDWLSVIPGNHDAYIAMDRRHGFDHWQNYMSGDSTADRFVDNPQVQFPYIRLRQKIALIGTSTATPTGPTIARGALGKEQRRHLGDILKRLDDDGYFRVVMIHHPPLPGQNKWRKALGDAKELLEILQNRGVELVLHGHNHCSMHETIDTATGRAAVVGVPSASIIRHSHNQIAAYNLYQIDHKQGRWHCRMTERLYNISTKVFTDSRSLQLL